MQEKGRDPKRVYECLYCGSDDLRYDPAADAVDCVGCGWPDGHLCSGGCGRRTPWKYCDECAKTAKCHHGNPLDCNECMVEGDLAYDAGRESR